MICDFDCRINIGQLARALGIIPSKWSPSLFSIRNLIVSWFRSIHIELIAATCQLNYIMWVNMFLTSASEYYKVELGKLLNLRYW